MRINCCRVLQVFIAGELHKSFLRSFISAASNARHTPLINARARARARTSERRILRFSERFNVIKHNMQLRFRPQIFLLRSPLRLCLLLILSVSISLSRARARAMLHESPVIDAFMKVNRRARGIRQARIVHRRITDGRSIVPDFRPDPPSAPPDFTSRSGRDSIVVVSVR